MPKSRSAYREFPNVSKFLEEKLVRRRKELKISQTALASKAGLTRNCIQQMECHEHLPLPSTIFKLLRALEFSDEEAIQFWVEIEEAYAKDRELQESGSKTPEMV
ncbi:MAG: helix-turn-helix transcriptional regulator [Oscillibacter sp.]|nr:helix-turn-helix transcriptional regulator [Oscillibacter sp.]